MNPFQTHFLLGQACLERIPSKPTMRVLSWQMGGSGKPASNESLQAHDACIVFANGGGGLRPPEPPRLSIFLGQACFKRIPSKPTMQALSWQMGGGAAPPLQPPRFSIFLEQACFKRIYSKFHDADIVLPNGGGLRPPQPPRFFFFFFSSGLCHLFLLGQACFKRIRSKPLFLPRASLLQTNPFQTHDAGIVLANKPVVTTMNPLLSLDKPLVSAATLSGL